MLLTKTKAWLVFGSMYAKQMEGKLFHGVRAQGKSRLSSRQLAGDCCKAIPQSANWFLEWTGPCGAVKMEKSCKDCMATN